MTKVEAYVYDISGGMAKAMSMAFIGKQVDYIPHTGIVAFGREYFFGSGPCIGEPGKAIGVPVTQVLDLGVTSKNMFELEAHIRDVLAREHTPEKYNFLSHNCNHYADDVAKFLLDGKGLPTSIVNIADEALNTPQGMAFRGMIENMEAQARGQMGGASAMNPFGDVGGAPPAAAPPMPQPMATAPSTVAAGPPVSLDAALRELLANPREVAKEALSTLLTIADNFIHKKDEKFRRLKKSNAAVQRKLTAVPGGSACLMALGFRDGVHDGEPMWIGPSDREGIDKLVDIKARFAKEYDRFNDIPVSEAPAQAAGNSGGIMGMIENALQNPAALQRLLSNPMIAQMARANPQLVEGALQNPSVQQALQQNPEMRGQVEQLIGRPLPAAAAAPTAPAPAAPAAPPSEEALSGQLAELADMGFEDRAACLIALQNTGGDLSRALDLLTGGS